MREVDTVKIVGSAEYIQLVEELKTKVRSARAKAAFAVNKEMILLYFDIGCSVLDRQQRYNWGDKFIENVGMDLQKEFAGTQGLSVRSIKYMKQFAEKFNDSLIGQQLVAQLTIMQRHELLTQIPWGHHTLLLDKKLPNGIYLWYVQKTIENTWSRNMLAMQIESDLYTRQASSHHVSNFHKVLPAAQSDLVRDLLKDPYILSFIDEGKDERELEQSLIQHIQKFLLELGKGFAFMGNQYKIEVGGENFAIDLLFYHVKLRCYVALELKVGKFKPEYAGKMQFYLTALDFEVKGEADNPSIGIILCKEKNKVIAEYALHGMSSPVGVANYTVKNKLPESLADSLPTIEELEKELSTVDA